MPAPRLLLAGAVLLAPLAAASAFDPRLVSILGLGLGMGRAEIAARLAAQGIPASRIREQCGPCTNDPAARCVTALTARTLDGDLLIGFVARAGPGTETVWRIAYTLAGRGASEPAMIRNAVMDQFGPPSSRDPPVWCARTGAAGCDPPDQPQLTWREGPGTSSTLDPQRPRRSAPAGAAARAIARDCAGERPRIQSR